MDQIRKILLLTFALLSFSFLKGQDTINTLYTESLVLDSVCKPDYYKVQIEVTEYNVWIQKGRRSGDYVLITLDSLEKDLIVWMTGMGIRRTLNKTNIVIVERSAYSGGNYSVATYEFNLYSKDSVEMLSKNIHMQWLKGIKVSTEMYKTSMAGIEKGLAARAERTLRENAERYAAKWGMKVNKVTVLTRSFNEPYDYQKQLNQMNNTNNIDLKDITCVFSIYITYSLK